MYSAINLRKTRWETVLHTLTEMKSLRTSGTSAWLRVKIGLQNAYRSRMKKSLGLSCIVNGVYVSPNILYPKFCWVIKGNRRGYFETRGGSFETNFRLPGGGGVI